MGAAKQPGLDSTPVRSAPTRIGSVSGTRGSPFATSPEILRSVFDHSPSGATVSDLGGRWLEINHTYCRMLGYRRPELVSGSYRDVTHPDDLAEDAQFVADAIAGAVDSLERDKRYLHKDGSIIWAHVRAEVIRDESGDALYFVSHAQNSGERPGTRDLFHDSERTLRAVIDNTPAMISVKGRDHRYKLVNREFEEHFGVDSAWIVGRRDADILPPSTLDAVHAHDMSVLNSGARTQNEEIIQVDGHDRLMLQTRFPLRDENGEIQGVCTSSSDITDRRVEERNKRERLQCSEMIFSALAEDRFVLFSQPIVHLASEQPEKSELLIRMRVTRGSDRLLSPAAFLPAAERFDLITAVDEWVIDRATALAAGGRRVTVNVSAKTISDDGHVDRIEAAVIASGAPAENLVFEVTETAIAHNLDAAHRFAVRIRDLGCGIALDDFGVGHGSFTYLRHVPIDYLKIDMQFVRNLLASPDDRQVVEAIIGVARQFRIETIAEGVEDQDTLDELRRMGVDFGQGFWIGPPVPLRPS